jgi:methyl-accepting chemotaxis protein
MLTKHINSFQIKLIASFSLMSIATAIREQSTVTQDIAGNIARASSGVRDANSRVAQISIVSGNMAKEIAEVSGISRQTGSAAIGNKS